MILPAARERLEALLRHPSMEGALGELRANAGVVSITGLHDVAKALVAVYLMSALRRPAFFLTGSNRRAEALAETLRFFTTIFSGAASSVATLPSFDRLPWESQSPHADILERRATTLFRLADGQISLVIAPMAAALWRYQDPAAYLYLTKTLAKDSEIAHEELITHLGSVGYTRTELVELPGQFAVRGGIIDVFSPEAPRPVRIELLGDTVESVREFDARTQRSIAPVVRTTLLPLTEWAVPAPENRDAEGSLNWESAPAFGPSGFSGRPKRRGGFPIQGAFRIPVFWGRHRPLGQRQQRGSNHRRNRTLCPCVELAHGFHRVAQQRSEEHTSELQSPIDISY